MAEARAADRPGAARRAGGSTCLRGDRRVGRRLDPGREPGDVARGQARRAPRAVGSTPDVPSPDRSSGRCRRWSTTSDWRSSSTASRTLAVDQVVFDIPTAPGDEILPAPRPVREGDRRTAVIRHACSGTSTSDHGAVVASLRAPSPRTTCAEPATAPTAPSSGHARRAHAPRDRRRRARILRGTGLHATSVDDIAEAAGVSRATLYQYFGSKDQLFVELIRTAAADLLRVIRRLGAIGPTAEGYDNLHWWLGEWAWVQDKYKALYLQWAVIDSPEASLRPLIAESIVSYVSSLSPRLAASSTTTSTLTAWRLCSSRSCSA